MVDPLSDVLRVVRLTGAFFYRVEASRPWSVEALPARKLAPLLLPGAQHVISYHIITSGRGVGGLLGEPLVPTTTAGWAACAGLGLMHVAGQGSIAWAMGRLPTPTASVVVLVQPVVAALLGYLLFAEAIGPLQGLGAAITLAGVVLAQWAARVRRG